MIAASSIFLDVNFSDTESPVLRFGLTPTVILRLQMAPLAPAKNTECTLIVRHEEI